MKKIASILVLVFAFSITTQAQKREKKQEHEKLSVNQQATLVVKKMALELDLSETQQQKLSPIISKQIEEKKAGFEKMKAARKSDKKPTADERYAFANARLDKQIAFKKDMKNILNKEQFEKFEKMKKSRKDKMGKKMKMMKKKRMSKKHKR